MLFRSNDRRLFALLHALRGGASPAELARRSGIDVWFLDRIQRMLEKTPSSSEQVVYKLVDTCAAEFEAYTPYYYSTYETPARIEPTTDHTDSTDQANAKAPSSYPCDPWFFSDRRATAGRRRHNENSEKAKTMKGT